jgi:hypothetical protein
MAGDVSITYDDAAVRLDIQRPGGPVDRAMSQLADGVVLSMKYRAPVYHGPPRTGPAPGHPRQVARASGTLRASIRKFRQGDGSWLVGPTDTVGPPWGPPRLLGPMIEHGTPPHDIRSRGPWPLYSTATRRTYGRPETRQARDELGRFGAGRELSGWVVHHPGTRPHPFIAPAARDLNGRRIDIR